MIVIGIIFILTVFGVSLAMFSTEAEPPQPSVTLNGQNIPVLQGSYCWKSKCVDMISPPELIKERKYTPVVAQPESKLSVQFEKPPRKVMAGGLVIARWNSDMPNDQTEHDTITLPKQKGSYIYTISAQWQEGSSSYIVAVEIR